MNLSVLLPLVYLFVGYGLYKIKIDLRKISSIVTIKLLLPLLILYAVITGFDSVMMVVAINALMVFSVIAVYLFFSRDPVRLIMFNCPNVGWTGVPIAIALFAADGISIMMGIFIVTTLLINAIGAAMGSKNSYKIFILENLKNPTTVVFIIALFLTPYADWTKQHFASVYVITIQFTAFLGMVILGQWLAITPFTFKDVIKETPIYIFKVAVYCVVTLIFYYLALYLSNWIDLSIFTDHLEIYFLFAVLPATSAVLVLENYYLGTGRSSIYVASNSVVGFVGLAIYIAIIYYFNLQHH